MPEFIGLRPPVDADLAVRQPAHREARVVDAAVVVRAEEATGVDAGAATLGPGDFVVGMAQARGGLAALGGAAAVAHGHGHAHRLGVESSFAADVEDLAAPVED